MVPVVFATVATPLLGPPRPFLTSPSVGGHKVAFMRAGDIWCAPLDGTQPAKRLTETAYAEAGPRLSADGRQVAYVGPGPDVWTIQVDTGATKRLTFSGTVRSVFGWAQDGQVAFATDESAVFPDSFGLAFVRQTGGQPTHTGVQEIGFASFPSGTDQMLYTPNAPSTASMAKFLGGRICQPTVFDLKTGKVSKVAKSRFSRQMPHYVGKRLLFVGTEGGPALNLFASTNGGTKQLTQYKVDGVRTLSCDREDAVFEAGGDLFRLDPNSGAVNPIAVRFQNGLEPVGTVQRKMADWLSDIEPSPGAGTAAVVSRGQLFVLGSDGNLSKVPQEPGTAVQLMSWNEDASQLAFVLAEHGRLNLYTLKPADHAPKRVAELAQTITWIRWATGSKGVYYLVDRLGVFYQPLTGATRTPVVPVPSWQTGIDLSPSGKTLSVIVNMPSGHANVQLVDLTSGETCRGSDNLYEDRSCAFAPDGKSMYFLSQRAARVPAGANYLNLTVEGGWQLMKMGLLDKSGKRAGQKGFDARSVTEIVPVSRRDYTSLKNVKGGLVLTYDGGEDFYDFASGKTSPLVQPSGSRFTSMSNDSVAIVDETSVQLAPWRTSQENSGKKFSLDKTLDIDLAAEWSECHLEFARFMAEKFYDPTLQGVDWPGMTARYAAYLPRVEHRSQLTALMARQMGELVGGHNFSFGQGDYPSMPRVPVGPDLGATFSWDGKGIRVDYVCRGRNDYAYFGGLGSDLYGNVAVGDYLVEIDGSPVGASTSIGERLADKEAEGVRLGFAKAPNTQASWTVTLSANHGPSRYYDFLERTREYVDTVSGGRVAYSHVFDTGGQGMSMFANDLSGQVDRQAIIVDARWNRGGLSNPGFIQALTRQSDLQEQKRLGFSGKELDSIEGPKCLLVNSVTVSGGDIFAYLFKSNKVGPIVGTTTAGRTIGNQWYGRTLDGMSYAVSESRNLDRRTGKDVGENVGTAPDYAVDMVPKLKLSGKDEQLEKAVDLMVKALDSQKRAK